MGEKETWKEFDLGDGGESPNLWLYAVLRARSSDGPCLWVDWWLLAVPYYQEGAPQFTAKGAGSPTDTLPSRPDAAAELVKLAESVASGFFRWDGCAEVDVGDAHTCNSEHWRSLWESICDMREMSRREFEVPEDE